MRRPSIMGFTVLSAMSFVNLARAEGIGIDHKAVGCMVAGKFPRLEAQFDPTDEVLRARVYFHAEGDLRWYYVDMKPEAGSFRGVLPQPLKSAKTVRYYIEVTGKVAQGRTPEYSPIVAGAGECDKRGGLVAGALGGSIKVAVGASAAGGAPLVPVGFSGAGVVAAGTATGATSAAGAAATTGGSHTGLVLGGVAVGAAGAGIALATHHSAGPTPTATAPSIGDITFLGSEPPPGSTISVGTTQHVLVTFTFSVVYNGGSGSYVLQAGVGSGQFPLFTGNGCVSQFSNIFSLTSGRAQTVSVAADFNRFGVDPTFPKPATCPLPLTTDYVGVEFTTPGGPYNPFGLERQFSVSYTFVP